MLRAVPLLALAACSASAIPPDGAEHYHCGEGFALPLQLGEEVTSRSPVEDFVLHRVTTARGVLVIYEGSAPQSGGIVIRTEQDWPNLIVVHESADNPRLAREIADRLLIGEQRTSHCPNRNGQN